MEYSYTHGKTLQTGEEIKNFQNKLNEIRDAFHCPWSYLTPDGIFGRNTRDAVKAFQIFANVSPVTGNLDSNTQRAIDDKYRESQRTYSSVKKHIDNYQYADALYTEGGSFIQESSAVVDEIWDSNKAQLESISKDVIDIITAIVSDKSQQSLNKKFQARQGEIKKLWQEYSEIMNRPKPALTPFNKPGYNNLESFYNATQERVNVNQGRLYQRRLDKGPEFSKLLKNEADAHLKRVAGAKALSKIGYGIPVLDIIYHGSKWFFAEGSADNTKCESEFKKSVRNALDSISFGAMTDVAASTAAKTATGAAGGPYGIAITAIIAILDIILVSTTGRSLSDRMVQLIKECDDMIMPKVTIEQISNGQYLPVGNGYYVPGIA